MAVGSVITRSSIVLFLLLHLLLRPGFFSNLKKLTDQQLLASSLETSTKRLVDKLPQPRSVPSAQLLRRHVGFTHVSRKGFFASRVSQSPKSISTFQITKILLCGDISMNPGPPLQCVAYDKTIARNHRAVECNTCYRTLHIKCGKIKPLEFDQIKAQTTNTWLCDTRLWSQLPFHDYCQSSDLSDLERISNPDLSSDIPDTFDSDHYHMCDNTYLETLRKSSRKGVLLCHLYINSLQNKFEELSEIIQRLNIHAMFVSETKIDSSYRNNKTKLHRFTSPSHSTLLKILRPLASKCCFEQPCHSF